MFSLHQAEDILGIEARVLGSQRAAYEVWISVEVDTDDEEEDVWLDGECTCPADPPCKHLAAVLFAARADLSLTVEPARHHPLDDTNATHPDITAMERWARHLEEPAPVRTTASPAAMTSCIVYVLRVCGTPRRVRIDAHSAYMGKRTRPTRTSHYDLARTLAGREAARYVTDVDRLLWFRLIRTDLGGPAVDAYNPEFPLTPAGTALFRDFVDTGRCYLEDTSGPPLSLGPERSGSASWVTDDRHRQHLRILTTPNETEASAVVSGVLPLSPAYYVELDGACGPLELSLPSDAAAALADVPGLEPEAALELPDTLREALQAHRLPLPKTPTVRQVDAAAAVPCLSLTIADDSSELTDPLEGAFADVHIQYEGAELPPGRGSANSRHRVEDGFVEVQRDLPAEERWLARLVALGATVEPGPSGRTLMHLPSSTAWLDFCHRDVQALRAEGWRIEIPPAFPLTGVDEWYLETKDAGTDWFSLELGVEIEGERVNLLPIVVNAIRSGRLERTRIEVEGSAVPLQLPDGRWLAIPAKRLATILNTLVELYDDRLDADKLRLPGGDAGRLLALEGMTWHGGRRLKKLAEQLARHVPLPVIKPPRALRGELRDYQARGLDWMGFLRSHGFGGVLADDMGLGKTIQTLAHLLVEKRARRLDRPCLVVAPLSVVVNWARECARFAPTLSCAVYHGPDRAEVLRGTLPDLVVTTYALLRLDTALVDQPWHVVALDEAQAIKNPRSRVASVARALDARQRLCLTGTPMENHLGELWSLFAFACPGLLGTPDEFSRRYRTPVERHNHTETLEALSARVAPFMLRRTKEQVLPELPPKTEIVLTIPLERRQRDLYESVRLTMEKRVRDALSGRGLAKSHIIVLDALLKLRQVCCHPTLVRSETARRSKAGSAKTDRLMELLEELRAQGRRTLVFSQFTSMLAIVARALEERHIEHRQITGKTRHRQSIVDAFQAGEFPVLLISLKAGGTGVNLTNADTVIHYDPWWNPAVETQATDRAHRIGQTQPVTVYRLVCEGSVEQRMLALQQRKLALATALQRGAERRAQSGLALDPADIEALLSPLSG